VGHVAHERTIDLERVERQGLERAEVGKAGSEIIERHAHALPGQLPQRLRTGRKIGDQGLLGDLDGQALGRKARVARAAQQAPGEIGQGKILGRDVEREPPCLGPALRAGHGRPGDMLRAGPSGRPARPR
jgi:hypothetical protein